MFFVWHFFLYELSLLFKQMQHFLLKKNECQNFYTKNGNFLTFHPFDQATPCMTL
jgi:hypothetical protein